MLRLAVLALAGLVAALWQPSPARAGTVRAADYSSFWIWGGVEPQPVLSSARDLYILQGQVFEKKKGNTAQAMVLAQGMPIAHLRKGNVWLVYRANTLNWTPEIIQTLITRLEHWRLSGNSVVGLQVDFDVRTRHLPEYAAFLRRLRTQLPAEYKLGITGLMDWSIHGDVEAINQLRDIVDEVAVQTYQGRRTIANHADYLPKLGRLALPFRIGLIQDGEWEPPQNFESNPWFRGYVVFLQNRAAPRDSVPREAEGELTAHP